MMENLFKKEPMKNLFPKNKDDIMSFIRLRKDIIYMGKIQTEQDFREALERII